MSEPHSATTQRPLPSWRDGAPCTLHLREPVSIGSPAACSAVRVASSRDAVCGDRPAGGCVRDARTRLIPVATWRHSSSIGSPHPNSSSRVIHSPDRPSTHLPPPTSCAPLHFYQPLAAPVTTFSPASNFGCPHADTSCVTLSPPSLRLHGQPGSLSRAHRPPARPEPCPSPLGPFPPRGHLPSRPPGSTFILERRPPS